MPNAVWPDGGGMAAQTRALDWSTTPLGPIEGWPERLRGVVDLVLASRTPMFVAAGQELILLYNEAYATLLGSKHPAALGTPFRQTFEEIGAAMEPMLNRVMAGEQEIMLDQRFELPWRTEAPEGWFTAIWTPLRDALGAVCGFVASISETSDAHHVHATLRENDAQQAFLLKLSDAVRPLAEPASIQGEATRLLREQLNAGWSYYVDWDLNEKTGVVLRDSAREGLPSLAGAHDVSGATEFLHLLAFGDVLNVSDYARYEQLPTSIRQNFTALGFRSMMVAPLVKEGRLIASLLVGDTKIRAWPESEVSLLVDVAERTWAAVERARAEAALRETEVRLARLADAAPVLIWETDENGATFVNSHYLAYFGVGYEDIAGFRWAQFIHPDDIDGYIATYQRAFAEGRSYVHECRLLRADGDYRWHRTSGGPASSGRFVGSCTDIHDLITAERMLREREADLARVQRIGEVGGLDIDIANGLRSTRSPEYLRLHGLPQDGREESHDDWLARVYPDDRDRAEQTLFDALESKALGYDGEYRIVRQSDGAVRWIHARADIERDADGKAVRLVGAHTDITEQKRSTEALGESQERQAVLLKLTDALRPLSEAGAIIAQATQILGDYLRADRTFVAEMEPDGVNMQVYDEYLLNGATSVVGHHNFDSFGAFVSPILANGDILAIDDIGTLTQLTETERAHYHVVGIAAYLLIPLVRNGSFKACFAINHRTARLWSANDRYLAQQVADRTWTAVERARAEMALRESEERLRGVLDAMKEGFAAFDADFVIRDVNQETLRLDGRGRDELVGRSHWDAFPGTEPSTIGSLYRRVARDRVPETAEYFYTWPDGRRMWVDTRAYPTPDGGVAVFWRDITERKDTENALREGEKRYRALFESMDEAYAVVDVLKDEAGAWVDFRFVEVNPAFIGHTSMPWPVGQTATELLGAPNPRWTQLYGQALDTGEAIRVEEDEPTLDRVFDLNIFTLDRERNRVAVLFTNITKRKRAEAALRESEERFQQFANASASGIWIRNAETMKMEFVSPAIATIYGTAPDAFIGDIQRWAAMIVPEDRDIALTNIQQARDGEPAIHEFRIRRNDGSFRWIRNTDFPLYDEKGNVERIGGIAEDVTETKMAVEHQSVLLAELQHRVRNIMAIIRSTAVRSADGAVDVDDYKTSLAGRLLALARVQTLLTRQANKGGSLRGILESEIGAQAHSENQYELAGPDLMLSPKAVEVLTLAFHELSTNALKYGALSVHGGKVSVTWTPFVKREKPWLAIDWIEEGAPSRPPPTRSGFGSELIEAKIPYELRGTGKTTFEPRGARCHIEFPLREAESILETDAPAPTRLYGGTVDMTGAPDLTGKMVLVVEDDYYVASDTAAALRGAGAEVLGPCPTEEDALRLLEEEMPTAVVLDLNLGGGGPRFEIAHRLLKRGTPFVFMTGYDPDVIPHEFADVVRLQKPIALRDIVEAVSRL